ncbi:MULTISPECIES: YbbR-like domain-containing protein [Terrabacteria group]|uniref:CdaR family protein n=1 Tax=Bacillati TaxID=1783272 RepID=UPI001939CF7B|nr:MULTISPECIES: CdaR family protein [Terrabacteria group]MBW9212835.1 hypothetical protein [Trueperella sp. zg.1013]QRG86357.1 hypothetical protein JOS54_05750 [Bulleidia sp. zg-1006]
MNKDKKTRFPSLTSRLKEKRKSLSNHSNTYEKKLASVLSAISSGFDKFLFNKKYPKLVAFLLAALLFSLVNLSDISKLYASTLKTSRTVNGVKVVANYNRDNFELSGLPSSANVILSGDATSLSGTNVANGNVVANLSDLSEGQHTVRLTTEGYGDNLDAVVDPTTVVVTLKKKTTQAFNVSYEFIHTSKMDPKLSLGTPELSKNKVNVRASQDTLNSIAFVKAFIDVSGKSETFSQEAHLVAYNSKGQPVEADIIPQTVSVKVPVTNNHKTVPIKLKIKGDIPNNKAIESVQLAQETVTIYGSEEVLKTIEQVEVGVNGENLTEDATLLRPLELPAGVSSASLEQVSMNIKLGDMVTRKIENVPINYRNNTNGYKVTQANHKTTTTVIVKGTESNVNQEKAEDIYVYIDLANAKPGLQDFALKVDAPKNKLVTYQLTENNYNLNVIGDK